MKFPLSWLKEYVNCEQSPLQIARQLTRAGIEVDEIKTVDLLCTDVVVVEVLSTTPHPQAEKLSVATVSDGTNNYQVVCGAPNCRPGIRTALAKVGASIVDSSGKKNLINKAAIRGVDSFGMLCSAKELGIGLESSGIIEFAEQIAVGEEVASIYADTEFNVSLTPNLGHCSSVMGIASELAAFTGDKLLNPFDNSAPFHSLDPSKLKIKIEEPSLCPIYCCCLIQNVSVAPSPFWLQKRLESCGIRSINNVVDATNYVLLEMGQPLHAFDNEKIRNGINVRRATPGESLVTLDQKKRVLSQEDLVIADEEKILALAGIMGGANSEVSAATRHILIESASFNPGTIRRTCKSQGLYTDASRRFEKGSDPNAASVALSRAAQLIREIAGGELVAFSEKAAAPFPGTKIPCSVKRINALLGLQLSQNEVETIFQKLHFFCEIENGGIEEMIVTVPTARNDLKKEIDLIEEVARVYGYDTFDMIEPAVSCSSLPHAPLFLYERKMRAALVMQNLEEFITCDLISPSMAAIGGNSDESLIKVKNPSSQEQSVLRPTLLPGILQLVRYNIDRQVRNIHGFEIGKRYVAKQEQTLPQQMLSQNNRRHSLSTGLYVENNAVAIVLSGDSSPLTWQGAAAKVDFYDLKGSVEQFLASLSFFSPEFVPTKVLPMLHPGRQAQVIINQQNVGFLGEVHPSLLRLFAIDQRVYFAEINVDALMEQPFSELKMNSLPLFPSSERDWTVTVPEELLLSTIVEAIDGAVSLLLEGEARVIAIYRSDKIGKDKKNITFRFVYRSKEITLDQETVDQEHLRIITYVKELLKLDFA